MERLTLEEAIKRAKEVAKKQRWNSKYVKVSLMNEELNKRHESDCIKDAEQHEKLAQWLEELKSYKEAEEQGLLVGLPCKVGTTVYDIFKKEIREIKVTSIEYNDNKEYVLWAGEDELLGTLNEAVFLTREEAEKKLEEMTAND